MTEAKRLFESLWTFYDQQLSAKAFNALDFAELVTYLLFLKIDDERGSRPGSLAVRVVPKGLGWSSLATKSGAALTVQFNKVLRECEKPGDDPETAIKQAVFHRAHHSFRAPAKLAELIRDHIGARVWGRDLASASGMYGLLLDRASENFEARAGQIRTPLALTSAVIDCVRPMPDETVLDPACGVGGLLMSVYSALAAPGIRLGPSAVRGADLDERMCRLATMNLLLHTGMPFTDPAPIVRTDSLEAADNSRPDVIVCNPPFRSTVPEPSTRADFIAVTSSFPLSFLQHIMRALPIGGRAAVFVPDSVLFGVPGERLVREWLLNQCNVHTLLRLPRGLFSRQGVMANVLFFEKARPNVDGRPVTETLWVYDFRTGQNFSVKERPLARADLDDFVASFHAEERFPSARFRPHSYRDLVLKDLNLNILCLSGVDQQVQLSPRRLAEEIATDLRGAAEEFEALADTLPPDDAPEGFGSPGEESFQ